MTKEKIAAAQFAPLFECHRAHLLRVAHRLLGSASEADDAVQEVWLRASRADRDDVQNLAGWLTTVTARVCLDHLRARKARSAHETISETAGEPLSPARDAESEAVAAESVSLALLIVLETLQPAERIAFVLHDLFGASFDEIAPVVQRSPEAARQLASRARRRVRGSPESDPDALARQRSAVEALLNALRAGDAEGVVAVLDPDVLVRAEAPNGRLNEIHGARNWARPAIGFARGLTDVELAMIDGRIGAIYAPGGKLNRVLRFSFGEDGAIVAVDIIGPRSGLTAVAIAVLP